MSAIDALVKNHLDCMCKEIDKNNCAFVQDLARLRAAASEADALRAERDQYASDFSALMDRLSNLDDVLNDTDECEAWSGCADVAEQFDPWESIRVMVETAKALRSTVAEQARQIEAAREVIDVVARLGIGDGTFVRIGNDTWPKCSDVILARAWLAANVPAPAPEAERTAPVVRYCEHCQRDTVTLDGACLWCNHVKPSPEAERTE